MIKITRKILTLIAVMAIYTGHSAAAEPDPANIQQRHFMFFVYDGNHTAAEPNPEKTDHFPFVCFSPKPFYFSEKPLIPLYTGGETTREEYTDFIIAIKKITLTSSRPLEGLFRYNLVSTSASGNKETASVYGWGMGVFALLKCEEEITNDLAIFPIAYGRFPIQDTGEWTALGYRVWACDGSSYTVTLCEFKSIDQNSSSKLSFFEDDRPGQIHQCKVRAHFRNAGISTFERNHEVITKYVKL